MVRPRINVPSRSSTVIGIIQVAIKAIMVAVTFLEIVTNSSLCAPIHNRFKLHKLIVRKKLFAHKNLPDKGIRKKCMAFFYVFCFNLFRPLKLGMNFCIRVRLICYFRFHAKLGTTSHHRNKSRNIIIIKAFQSLKNIQKKCVFDFV